MIFITLLTTLVPIWSQTLNLDFDPNLQQSILEGKKTATIRSKWRDGTNDLRDYTQNDGSGYAVFPNGKRIALTIEYVDFIYYIWDEDNITKATLKREGVAPSTDGFYNLLKSLQTFYPNMTVGDEVTVVYFHLKD